MLRLHISLALALLLGCAAPQVLEQPNTPTPIQTIELRSAPKHILGPFIYQIVTRKGYMGVEFIAGGRVWTIQHLLDGNHKGPDVCIDLGPHPYRRGLEISDSLIFVHQKLWYLSTHGVVSLVVVLVSEHSIHVAVTEGSIVPGDSGSPVFDDRGEVVGSVSATYPSHPFYNPYEYGVIGRF